MTKMTRRAFATAGGAAAVGAGALAMPSIARAQTTTWRMQTVDPPGFVGPQIVFPRFAEAVEEMSDGRLKIEVSTAGQLVPTGEIPAALEAGVIDIAYTNTVYYTGSIAASVLSTTAMPPLIVPTVNDGQEIYWNRGVDEIIGEAYAENGVHYLGSIFLGDPITYWSRERMEGVDDLQGFKVRTFGYAAKTFEALGASPVFMPHEEVYTALAQGVIDGSMTAASYYKRASYFEPAPFFYEPGWFTSVVMCIMASPSSWEPLPDDLKAIVRNAVRIMSLDLQHHTWLEYRQMLAEFEDMGATRVVWPDSEMEKVRKAAFGFLPSIKEMGPEIARGVEIIEDYLAEIYG